MNELKLTLDTVNPAQFWGPNNENYEMIKGAFAKLKIVARGSDVKVLGDEQELKAFEEKFNQLVGQLEKYSSLSNNDVESILGQKANGVVKKDVSEPTGGGGEVIVFGTNGLLVKARTANQRKMVTSIGKNDILFCHWPRRNWKNLYSRSISC